MVSSILPYSFGLCRIFLDPSEFSRFFSDFPGFFPILSYSFVFSRILRYFLKIFPNSALFSWIFLYSLGFFYYSGFSRFSQISPILTEFSVFTWIYSDYYVFSRIFPFPFEFFWSLPDYLGCSRIFSYLSGLSMFDSFEFSPILLDFFLFSSIF
mgnify:CR=1 FL=1